MFISFCSDLVTYAQHDLLDLPDHDEQPAVKAMRHVATKGAVLSIGFPGKCHRDLRKHHF